MAEIPHPDLLNREAAAQEVLQHFRAQLDAMHDMVNYGTNLVLRAYRTSAKTTVEVITLGVLLKQIVAMADAVEALLRAGIVDAAFLQARAALEALLYLEWILYSDTDHKAKCYLVANLRHELLWARRGIKGTAEANSFGKVAKALGIDFNAVHPTLEADAESQVAKVERNLAVEGLQDVNAAFDLARKQKKGRHWYVPAGANSLREIAEQVGRVAEYEFYYSKGSHVTHSALYKDHVRFGTDQVRLRGIRSLRQADDLIEITLQVLLGAFIAVHRYYRPEEMDNFRRIYTETWREAFRTTKQVHIAGD